MKSRDHWVLLDVMPDGTVKPHSKFDRERFLDRTKTVKADRHGNKQIRASLAQVRSLPQLRLYWPWIRKVVDNSEHFTDERPLHNMLLTACGVVENYITIEGEMRLMPSSIAFDAMGDEEFTKYFERAQQIVSESILPGVDLKSLMTEAKSECQWPEAA
ncbi:hypothetical protein [Methylobacterium sp. WL120]|uniref:hypothetical protein n=1 Tax=Methylobacterium sp. WL120 TaxID=2603887 RepID=UPI0011C93ABE|nr:hypothetical protein [Methylobacterium sp. WL120]TXM69620.1 hypothetical protein FV229_04565 [Methylobacterium sp. WL120]